jgi:hypothetical protein
MILAFLETKLPPCVDNRSSNSSSEYRKDASNGEDSCEPNEEAAEEKSPPQRKRNKKLESFS